MKTAWSISILCIGLVSACSDGDQNDQSTTAATPEVIAESAEQDTDPRLVACMQDLAATSTVPIVQAFATSEALDGSDASAQLSEDEAFVVAMFLQSVFKNCEVN